MKRKQYGIFFRIPKDQLKLIKAEAKLRGKTIQETGIMLFSAWMKIKQGGEND